MCGIGDILPMFCPNCGCELPAVAKFCVRCGARVDAFGSSSQSASSVSSPSPARVQVASIGVEASKAAVFPGEDAQLPQHAYVKESTFVVPKGAVLPNRCVKCANVATEPWLKKTFSWHPPGFYLLAFSPIL